MNAPQPNLPRSDDAADAYRFRKMMDAAGQWYENSARAQLVGRLRELCDAEWPLPEPQPNLLAPIEDIVSASRKLLDHLQDSAKFDGDLPDEIYIPFSKAVEDCEAYSRPVGELDSEVKRLLDINERICDDNSTLRAELAQRPVACDRNAVINRIIRDVAELDYNSPEDQPDVMLVTAGQLRGIIESKLEAYSRPAQEAVSWQYRVNYPVRGWGPWVPCKTERGFRERVKEYRVENYEVETRALFDRPVDRRTVIEPWKEWEYLVCEAIVATQKFASEINGMHLAANTAELLAYINERKDGLYAGTWKRELPNSHKPPK